MLRVYRSAVAQWVGVRTVDYENQGSNPVQPYQIMCKFFLLYTGPVPSAV